MRLSTLFLFIIIIALHASAQWKPGEPITDSRDGRIYKTVMIGAQIWMAENMNIGTMIPSTQAGSQMSDNGVIEKYCWGNDTANCNGANGVMKRGGFYEWQEATQYWNGQPSLPVQGLCPKGWHIPSNAEWNTLIGYLGGATAYTKMVAGGGSGFDALMTGYRCTMSGTFRVSAMNSDTRTYFWTAEQTDAVNISFLEVGQSSLQSIPFQKSVGLCIRCILDNAPQGVGETGQANHFEVLSMYVDQAKQLNMHFASPRTQYRIGVYDCLGRLVNFSTFSAVDGNNLWRTDVSHLPKGVYFINLTSGKGITPTQRFVIE